MSSYRSHRSDRTSRRSAHSTTSTRVVSAARSFPRLQPGTKPTVTGGRQYTIKVNHLPLDTKEREVYEYYRNFGSISNLRVISSSSESYALINYETDTDAEEAMRHTNGKEVFGCTVRVVCKWKDNAQVQHTLKVTNLSLNVTQEEMEDVCRSYTDYQSLKVNKGYAYVNFSSLQGAATAMEFLKKVKFYGQCPIVKLQDKDSIQVSPNPPQIQAYTFSPSFTHPPAHSPLPSASPDGCIPLPTQTHIPPLARVFPRVPLSAPHSHAFPFPVCHSSQAQLSHNRKSTAQSSTGESSTIKATFGSSGITGEVLEAYFCQFGKVLKTAIISGNPDYAYVNLSQVKKQRLPVPQKRCISMVCR
ncbi:PREDICTED: polyadenylate-binding protein 4-like [Amphimedon queenslandica]|uniref:RRM domain-containing protein n=1 Tax=Amphimedon queenslandica TaxID=400682 RepID=A0A1X7SWW4_AMPQE|nr:PREDICTED: polyadenylate-binding protein 4-like [Amphimedon queenslandica]|eukprot:XP_019862434.1 PREDICTED: polyadenylate-binding protein 4-like [Amphimedon queenslandica]